MCKRRSHTWMAPRVFEGVVEVIYHTLVDQATEMCSSKSLEHGEHTPLSKSPDSSQLDILRPVNNP